MLELENREAKESAPLWQSWALGAAAGLLNGLVALGGGILITPFLVTHRQLTPQVAVGTSLVIVVLLSIISFVAHASHGNLSIDLRLIIFCAVGGMLGTAIGSKVLAALTPRWLMKLFAVFLILVSARLIMQGIGVNQLHVAPTATVPWAALFIIGAGTGLMSAIFGIGGGALALVALVTAYGVPLKEGLPVALALNISNTLSGTVHHAYNKSIQWREIQALVPAAIIGVLVGAWLAQFAPEQMLQVIFGSLLLVLAVRLWRKD